MFGRIIKLALVMCLIEGCVAMPKISGILSPGMGYEMTVKDTGAGMFLYIVLSNKSEPTFRAEYSQCISINNKPSWLEDNDLTNKFLQKSAEELTKQNGMSLSLIVFIKNLSQEMEQKEELQTVNSNDSYMSVSSDILYMGLESAWTDLNDLSKKRDFSADVSSVIYSAISYVENNGNTNTSVFKKLLGRLCHEYSDALSSLSYQEKNLLKLEKVIDLKQYGLELLKQAAIYDSEAEDYLTMGMV